jgi:flagellar biosynthesis protein FlhB
MSEVKNFPPSEQKLRQLRHKGILPKSPAVLSLGALLGLTFGFRSARQYEWPALAEKCWKGNCLQSPNGDLLPLSSFFHETGTLLLTVLFPVLIMVLLLGLFQTRFLFSIALLRFDLSRMAGGLSVFRDMGRRCLDACATVVVFAAWAAICYLFAVHLLSQTEAMAAARAAVPGSADHAAFLTAVREDVGKSITEYESAFWGMLYATLGFSAALACLSYFSVLFRFRNEHSMSRAEVEAEAREQEASPEMREAQRALLESDDS